MRLLETRSPGLALFFCLYCYSHIAGAEKRTIIPDDLVDLRIVADPQISPDGEWVALVVTELPALAPEFRVMWGSRRARMEKHSHM